MPIDNEDRVVAATGPSAPPVRGPARSTLTTLIAMIGVTAVLSLGREVFLPLAIALLLTFALAPIVSFLRRKGVPRVVAVISTVAIAFIAIGLFSFIVATQVATLAQNLPTYQSNILSKIHGLREAGAGAGVIERLSEAVQRIGIELEKTTQAETGSGVPKEPDPLPVEVVTHQSPLDILKGVILPLVSPFATSGLILVVVIFMLLEREDLRDRFIRLVGYSDLNRTTAALEDAGKRVGRYLLMQLVVNTLYAIPITIGLWVLGIPNALLWGLLALVVRFVPYIGPAIGMLLPLFLAIAVAPGWSLLLWTGALFLLMEFISGNVLEPWLYGTNTGLSPLAIIVAAIFWTWLWGPLGLVMSTPLTVCLVVLGRYVPQFEFLDVLLGDEPVLEPHARLYQRLLAGDPDEATDHAENFLQEGWLVDFYDQVGLPALLLGEQDRQRGLIPEEQRQRLATGALALVANLEEIAQEENEEDDAEDAEEEAGADGPADEAEARELPDGEGRRLLCVGGRDEVDDAAAAMLAQVLGVQDAEAFATTHADLAPRRIGELGLAGVDTVIVAFLNPRSLALARHVVRRLKRARKGLRVGLLIPVPANGAAPEAPFTAEAVNADFVATGIADAVIDGLSDAPPVPLKLPGRSIAKLRPASRRRPAPAPVKGAKAKKTAAAKAR
jgi:predicted PurR-regulated permease PerM